MVRVAVTIVVNTEKVINRPDLLEMFRCLLLDIGKKCHIRELFSDVLTVTGERGQDTSENYLKLRSRIVC